MRPAERGRGDRLAPQPVCRATVLEQSCRSVKSRRRRSAGDAPPKAARRAPGRRSRSRGPSTPSRAASRVTAVEHVGHRRPRVVGQVHRHLDDSAVQPAARPWPSRRAGRRRSRGLRARSRAMSSRRSGQVHVEGDQGSRARRRPQAPAVGCGTRGPKSGAQSGVASLAREPFEPAVPDVLEAAARPGVAARLVQEDREVEPLGDAADPTRRARATAVRHRRAPRAGTKGTTSSAPIRRMDAAVRRQIDSRRSRGRRGRGRRPRGRSRAPTKVNTDRLCAASAETSSRRDAGGADDGGGQRGDDRGAAPLADVGYALDRHERRGLSDCAMPARARCYN